MCLQRRLPCTTSTSWKTRRKLMTISYSRWCLW
uniref:Uncharacterized protein n=1 Tax=Anguilla anguilla TaxID=7936 RepID=A0A0E9VS70_ANGAN